MVTRSRNVVGQASSNWLRTTSVVPAWNGQREHSEQEEDITSYFGRTTALPTKAQGNMFSSRRNAPRLSPEMSCLGSQTVARRLR